MKGTSTEAIFALSVAKIHIFLVSAKLREEKIRYGSADWRITKRVWQGNETCQIGIYNVPCGDTQQVA